MDVTKRLQQIDVQLEALALEKKALLQQLDVKSKSISNPIQTGSIVSTSFRKEITNQQIQLFRGLFKSREDVFARRWVSKKTGKTGYSPVCKNEWAPKLCQKQFVRCSDCPNRELLPLTDEILRKHLQGEFVVGIYPLLPNEACHFLAADFDGDGWMDNVFAFSQTAQREGITAYVERSRSGNGAHSWIFFSDEVSASQARKLGGFLLTQTMAKRYQMELKSYDRFFPNQDTVPKGGFGNLIALPLQGENIQKSNSVFLDESGNPHADQWLFLSQMRKVSVGQVEFLTRQATSTGQVLGVRTSPQSDDDLPWMLLPSGKTINEAAITGLPDSVALTIGNRLYLMTEGVPSALLNKLKRIAAFQNPEFYRRQSMRFSTALTPRIVSCAELIGEYLVLPRGCFDDVQVMLKEYGVEAKILDKRFEGRLTDFAFSGKLSQRQDAAVKQLAGKDCGVLVAPPGSGKTVMAIALMALRNRNVLVLLHRKPLMEQWKARLSAYLDLKSDLIGQIGGGKDNPTGIIDVAMLQSMGSKGIVDDRIAGYGFIIVDECHHVGAISFERVLAQAKGKYVLGLTATPYRRDGHQPIIHMQCGPVVCSLRTKDFESSSMQSRVVIRQTAFRHPWNDESKIYELWPMLIKDNIRNELIVRDILQATKAGRFPIVITERKDHLELLAHMIEGQVDCIAVLHGGIKAKQRQLIINELSNWSNQKSRVLLATGAYIGEGFDEPRLDTLFIAMPISFKGKLVQYLGRLNRQHAEKQMPLIHDYHDSDVIIPEVVANSHT
jgi:superfamily II DNA or RNA helicase